MRWLALGLLLAASLPAHANDRLPPDLRAGYDRAFAGVRDYARYILRKVWRPQLAVLAVKERDRGARRARAAEIVDEIVDLVLPHGRKLLEDGLYGTGETHVGVTRPRPRALAEASKGAPAGKDLFGTAIAQALRTYERALDDRLEQALAEDLEDSVQRDVEEHVGLPVVGRPRSLARALPPQWEPKYRAVRPDVHEFTYWHLRKKQRLRLGHLAATRTHEALDEARHTGTLWGMTSGISHEAWAQNRWRMDFQFGRVDWETQRRRIRRRMDQDQAQAAWGLARLVKELTAPETEAALRQALREKMRERLSEAPLREKAERFPKTRDELQRELERVKDELDPMMNRAMDRVPLPPDMRDLAREHGRRYMKEELQSDFLRALPEEAAALAAARRVRERLPEKVAEALARADLDPTLEERTPEALRGAARRQALEAVDEEIEGTLRASGLDTDLAGARRARTLGEVRRRFQLDDAVDRELERQAPPR
jgi:hypothetical protein